MPSGQVLLMTAVKMLFINCMQKKEEIQSDENKISALTIYNLCGFGTLHNITKYFQDYLLRNDNEIEEDAKNIYFPFEDLPEAEATRRRKR